MIAEEAYVLSKSFTNNSLKGITGALAGKNCTIKSATKADGVTTVVFAWIADDGTEKTTTIQVNDGNNDYEDLINKPKIEGVDLIGNKTFEDLGAASVNDLARTDGHLQDLADLVGDKVNLPMPNETVVNNIEYVDTKADKLKEDLGNYYFKTIIKPVYTTQEIVVGVINDSNGQIVGINGNSTVYLQELDADENKISSYQCKTLAFYDSNKIFLSAAIVDANGWTTADIPLNAKYVSYSWADDSDFKIAYGNEHKNPLYEIGVPTTLEEKVDNYIVGLNITPNQCSFLKIGLNLFNKNEEFQDKFLNDGVISDLNDYCVSDYIPVKKDNTYVCNKDLPKYDLFDSEKKFIKEFAYTAGQPIVPTKDGYIVICYYSPTSDKHTSDEMMVCMGDTVPTDYSSFCYYPNSTEKYPIDFNETWYKDKYICTFGDSNTANARWQDFMCNKLKCTYQNCGIGGSSMAGTDEHAMWTDFRVGQISEKTNAILIMAGTNDGASSREVGVMSLDNTDTNTFVGAYNTCIRKIYTKMGITFPIFLFTPIPCFNTTTYPRVKEMANAIKEIGAMWSLPVIDAQNECGINVANWESLYASDGVHVDYEGGKMLASLVVGILKSHEPID